ncbi:hypothetical protein SPRG_03269 [Saprolegnia parasitica CBS 223.65]|uniref:Uncharacterized protein n=1 Tax=Saprolegnia parasitica (strain CBS 223.65) TaxID=695850 RepID=A0A067CZU9_SAPPC|nr:hypothetical protein SPRG_03269 [Saprolegnia parasitica CBS 223.65]KDO32051.1 hypothetical protein SPRG_03269 [Saprolegnia parasitica CBS 223.65]|eukprot:XP_012197239.1 hypothetical protein SPRG_03269 [Saprolegnia parasitica CBS 223.65]
MSYHVAKRPHRFGSALLSAWLIGILLLKQWLSHPPHRPSAATTLLYERHRRFPSQPEDFHVLVTAVDDTFALWIESASTRELWSWALSNNGATASADLRRNSAGALVLELTIPACFGAVARYAFPVARMQLNSAQALRARLCAAEAERDLMARQIKQIEHDHDAATRAQLATAAQRSTYEACVRRASEGWTNVYRNCEHLAHGRR